MSQTKSTKTQSMSSNLDSLHARFLQLETMRVESMHMLANLCPLSDIVIPPVILPPPHQLSPDMTTSPDSIVHLVLPYLPDWPEFMAPFAAKRVNVTDLFQGGMNIALIGKPGIGKSTALAYFALQLLNKVPRVEYLGDNLPLVVHASDIIENGNSNDPIQILVKILCGYYPEIKPDKLYSLLETSFNSASVILFIDGVDELPRNLIAECHSFITKLNAIAKDKFKLLITAPLDYLDGFALDDTYPVAMGLWNSTDINNYLSRITPIYTRTKGQPQTEQDDSLINASLRNWIPQNRNQFTPLEITIQAITSLSGFETGKTSFDIMNSFVDLVVPNRNLRNSLEVLAYQTLISENPIINKYELNHYAPELASSEDTAVPSSSNPNPKKALSLKSRGIILRDTAKGNTIFAHPIYLGFLASNAVIRNGQFQSIIDQRDWASKETALYYLTHLIDVSQYLDYHDVDNDSPLHSKLFAYSHWLNEGKITSIWRPQILKRLAQVLNTDNLPIAIRAKALAALCFSNEKGIAPLFQGYLLSRYPTVRLLAALGCGILQETNSINRLADLLADPESSVRIAACMALYAMNRDDTFEFTVKILLQAGEDLRRAASELLSLDPFKGREVFEDGVTHPDLLVRRALVYGLGLVRDDWSRNLLRQLQVKEAQWVVRTAALEALEMINGADPSIPRKLSEPHLCPWLIKAASNTGEGISPGIPPVPLLLKLLIQGTDDEKYGALQYLSTTDQESIIIRIYDMMYTQTESLREAAFYACWRISLSGVELPSTRKFGYS